MVADLMEAESARGMCDGFDWPIWEAGTAEERERWSWREVPTLLRI